MNVPPIVLWLVIIANAVMFSYLMIYIPYACQNIAVASNGTALCALSVGAYLRGGNHFGFIAAWLHDLIKDCNDGEAIVH